MCIRLIATEERVKEEIRCDNFIGLFAQLLYKGNLRTLNGIGLKIEVMSNAILCYINCIVLIMKYWIFFGREI